MEETEDTLDNNLINEIVCKVKSEGLFDQFRRDCLADVDTKPAYQNLQNRVESSVSSFLELLDWNSQVNKNQLRERLKKLVLEKKFFEAGIERIVDQVVDPKLNSNFVPKIEDIAYKLIGIDRPSTNMKMKLEIETEPVSPDSENDSKLSSNTPKKYVKGYQMYELEHDLESPAFEPIEPIKAISYNDDDDMDISDCDSSSNGFDDASNKILPHESNISIDEDAELSQVSSETSTSRLSIVTNEDISINVDCLGINEETQMQTFNESSSSNGSSTEIFSKDQRTQFSIKNEKIKFKVTKRTKMPNATNYKEKLKNSLSETDEEESEKKNPNIRFTERRNVKGLQKSQSKDDHFTHKGKTSARQRSHSKDSNDGFTYPNTNSDPNVTKNTNQSKSSNEQAYTQYSSDVPVHSAAATSESLVKHPAAPVVIDQILIGNDLDLNSFLQTNRAEPIIASLEEDILFTNTKKPKLASNIFEAKRLSKVRKRIDLRFQKKIEQAKVKAKQYIRDVNIRDECQGIELEFVCRKSIANELDSFCGFDSVEKDKAHIVHQTLKDFVEGNIPVKKDSEIILATRLFHIPDESLEKKESLVRYTNGDLFKPTPLLCEISQMRRFQENH